MNRRQSGAGGLFIAVILLLVAAGVMATWAFLQSKGQGERTRQDEQRFNAIKAAMVQYVAINTRLPCPANPTANPETGSAEPETASAACTYPQGTVPWKTLGLRRDDAIDAWARKISYRVYTGAAGSLTQANGASMVSCDTTDPYAQGVTPVSGSAGGICRSQKDSTAASFLAGKGLSVNWFGTAVTDAAYVLVSHGPSGLGAYPAGAPSTQLSLPTGTNELNNLNAAGPFVATNRSISSVSPTDPAHFDDVLAYVSLPELIRVAGLSAREWSEFTADTTLDMATVSAALGSTPAYGDLNVSTLYFDAGRVTGLASSGAATQGLTLDTSGGIEGLGTAAGTTGIGSQNGEGVRIEVKVKATQFAVTLNHFGTLIGIWKEQAQFNFYDGASLVSTTVKQGCNPDGGLASFSFDLGATQFDRVEILPQTTSVSFNVNFSTTFFLSAFKTCNSGACTTSLQNAGNTCP